MAENRKKWTVFLYIVPIFWMAFEPSKTLPLFRIPFIGYIVAIAALILVSNSYLKQKEFWLALMYGLVVFLNFWIGNVAFPSLFSVLYEVFRLMVPAAIFYYYSKVSRNKPFVNSVLLLYLFVLVFETIATYRLEQVYPGLMRNLHSSRYEDDLTMFMQMGLAPYSLPHALPTLIPAIVLVIKDGKNNLIIRVLTLVFLAASLVIVYLSQATGAYLMTIFSLVLAFIVNSSGIRNNMTKLVIVSVLALPFVLFPSFTDTAMDVAEMFVSEDSDVYEKIEEVRASNSGAETSGDIAYRGELLDKTLNTIIEHPLFGSRTKTYGNHNALLDRMAKLGLVGFLPLLMFLILTIKGTYKEIPEKGKIFYLIGVSAAVIMLLSKNQISWDQWFFLFYLLPVLIIENDRYEGFHSKTR